MAPASILLIAIILRCWNLSWGLPDILEEAFPLQIALRFWDPAASGTDFNPHFFHYPGLMFYFTWGVQGIVYTGGSLMGFFTGVTDFLSRTGTLAIISRIISALFDTGTILIVYRMGRILSGRITGLTAAFLIAISPAHIEASHQITVDIPLAFFSTLALYLILRMVDSPAKYRPVIAGLPIGCAAATKYTGALLLVVFTLIILINRRRLPGFRGNLIMGVTGAAGAFLMFNPYILLSFREFRQDFSFEQFHMAYGHLGIDQRTGAVPFYLFSTLPSAFGWPVTVLMLCGAAFLIIRRDRALLYAGAFPLLLLIMAGTWAMRADRYFLPALPSLAVLTAVSVSRAIREFSGKYPGFAAIKIRPYPEAAMAGAVALFAVIPLAGHVVSYERTLGLPDSRVVSRTWLERHFPPGSTLATGPAGISFPPGRFALVEIPFTPTGSEDLLPFYNPRWYQDLDAVITTDIDRSRFRQEPERFRGINAYFDTLERKWTLIHESPAGDSETGPGIRIYRPPIAQADSIFPAEIFGTLAVIADTGRLVQFCEQLAYAHFLRHRLLKSEQLLRFSLELDPSSARLLREYAWTLYREEKYFAAEVVLNTSLGIDLKQAEIHGLLGSVLLRTGRPDQAAAELEQALTLNPKLEFAYLDLELLYRTAGDTVRQRVTMERYLAILPPGSDNARLTRERLDAMNRAH